MSDRRMRYEKWLYRLLLIIGAAAWAASLHQRELARWWTYHAHELKVSFPLLIPALWIVIRRPRWPAALAAMLLTGLAAAIFLPCGRVSRSAAESSACRSNLRQLALAALDYAADHDDRLPAVEVRWTGALQPYLKSETMLHCPADDEPISYELNPYLRGRKLSELPRGEADVILAYESAAGGLADRHYGAVHVAYCDGTVRTFVDCPVVGTWNPWEQWGGFTSRRSPPSRDAVGRLGQSFASRVTTRHTGVTRG